MKGWVGLVGWPIDGSWNCQEVAAKCLLANWQYGSTARLHSERVCMCLNCTESAHTVYLVSNLLVENGNGNLLRARVNPTAASAAFCHTRCPSVITTGEMCSVPLNRFDLLMVHLTLLSHRAYWWWVYSSWGLKCFVTLLADMGWVAREVFLTKLRVWEAFFVVLSHRTYHRERKEKYTGRAKKVSRNSWP